MNSIKVQNVCAHVVDLPTTQLSPAEIQIVERSPDVETAISIGILCELPLEQEQDPRSKKESK